MGAGVEAVVASVMVGSEPSVTTVVVWSDASLEQAANTSTQMSGRARMAGNGISPRLAAHASPDTITPPLDDPGDTRA